MTRLLAVTVVGGSLLGLWWAGRDDPAQTAPAKTPTTQPAGPPKRVIVGRFDGVAIQVFSADNAVAKYGRLIREVADLGAKCVILSLNGYQEKIESVLIATKPEECPTDEVWLELFKIAHDRGMKVVLMPKVLLTDPNGAWRGKIQPPSWEAWFSQYRKFILHYAALAERGGVELFLVGSELISTEKLTEEWKGLIHDARDVFGGLLGYSANWDHYTGIQFWGDLDVVGMTTYHKLADDPSPTVEHLRESWKPIREKILAWREKIDRPVLFTEVGWCSQEGASIEPWNYYHKEEATPAGHEEQRRNYQAFLDTWSDQKGIVGIIWWEWTESEGGPDDFGYTPRKKPAEAVLREWLRLPDGR